MSWWSTTRTVSGQVLCKLFAVSGRCECACTAARRLPGTAQYASWCDWGRNFAASHGSVITSLLLDQTMGCVANVTTTVDHQLAAIGATTYQPFIEDIDHCQG